MTEVKPLYADAGLGMIATQFAVAVQREINIRNGCFVPHTDKERTWKTAGAVAVKNLDTVREYTCE
jgi:hypothetical protein